MELGITKSKYFVKIYSEIVLTLLAYSKLKWENLTVIQENTINKIVITFPNFFPKISDSFS